MAASVLSLLHFWFVAYFSLRRGKRSAVSKSMLAVWKLKAPEIAFAACRGPWDDRLIFPDPDKPDPPFAEGRAGPRQCAGDGHEEELSARTFCGVSFRCPLTLAKPTSNIPRLDVCLCPQRTRRIESFHGKRCNRQKFADQICAAWRRTH
jgi:hypothetical protein